MPCVWYQCDRKWRILPARAVHSQGERDALTQGTTIKDKRWSGRALTCSVSCGGGKELGSWEGSAGVTGWGGLPFQQGTLRGGLCTEEPLSLLAGLPAWHLTQHEWPYTHACKCLHASQGVESQQRCQFSVAFVIQQMPVLLIHCLSFHQSFRYSTPAVLCGQIHAALGRPLNMSL